MAKKIIKSIARWGGIELTRYDRKNNVYDNLFDEYHEFTMIPREAFITNLELCDQHRYLKGDFVECGVWRGGMSAAISEVLGKERKLHLFDSFEGLPFAKVIDGEAALAWQQDTTAEGFYDNCRADESFAKEAMKMADHRNYTIYKGWFHDTLTRIETTSIGILRLDGDWYDSIKVCLNQLFPLLVDGGLVIIDDYYAWDGCAKAVHDYLSENKSSSRIYQSDNNVAYIIKKN